MKKKGKPVKGLMDGLWEFLKVLEEMEKKGLTEHVERGDLEGPFDSKVKYEYRTRVGLGIRPRSRESFADKQKESLYKTVEKMPTKVITPEDVKEKEKLAENGLISAQKREEVAKDLQDHLSRTQGHTERQNVAVKTKLSNIERIEQEKEQELEKQQKITEESEDQNKILKLKTD